MVNNIMKHFSELKIAFDDALLRRYSEINNWCWQQLELPPKAEASEQTDEEEGYVIPSYFTGTS